MRLLLIEDDDRIAGPLTEGLGRYGFTVDHVRTGAAGLADADAAAAPDLVLLDLGLPDMDGLDVCRSLRARSAVPIIMITARGEEADRIVGLELGADDYLAKPFGVRELIARIRAVTRRAGAPAYAPTGTVDLPEALQPASGAQELGPLAVNRRTREIHLAGQHIALTPREFDLLAFLADDPGTVHSRQQIMDAVWDPHFFGPTKTLDAHVAALRRKLGDPGWITTARGVGFRLTVPGDHSASEGPG
ncbi:response regulator transcription factor [Streptomyces sp. ME18-1-4]|uniref:response regulator transcription factor n=1 Tax=Streptomyces sp. ME18-1-4 TaxID=3028685 RepID=UPI0029AF60B1|nr:response regulator transcription factor [Streptomyces sp. ME18-1-4]MDX3247057.1 response regulator transcription factor [Streptomyces sp. ME18-1-4]